MNPRENTSLIQYCSSLTQPFFENLIVLTRSGYCQNLDIFELEVKRRENKLNHDYFVIERLKVTSPETNYLEERVHGVDHDDDLLNLLNDRQRTKLLYNICFELLKGNDHDDSNV